VQFEVTVPTIRDRVVQTAAKLVLEPIFEADLDPAAYGYRPKRSGAGAIKAVHALLCRGYTDVVDADLSKYFDTIPHQDLMRSVDGIRSRAAGDWVDSLPADSS
jgi:RNA-directed DNA polymerase